MKKILVLGASGLVGRALCQELQNNYKVYGTYNNNKVSIDNVEMIKFDTKDSDKICDILYSLNPTKIIISLTGNYEQQFNVINHIAEYSKENNSTIYFVSTWNVFDTNPNKTYYENDERSSKTDYGLFKINAENFLLDNINDRCTILRLPMIWGKNSPRLNKLKENLSNKEAVEIVTNMILSNNTDVYLAKQIKYIVDTHSNGIFHLGSSDEISHSDFIKSIVNKLYYDNVEYKEVKYGEDKVIVSLGSNNKLPKELQVSNQDIINNLI